MRWLMLAAFTFSCLFVTPTFAEDVEPEKAKQKSTKAGDNTRIVVTLPFETAMAKAKRENKLLFLKPIYGGVDNAGAQDYRCGSW